MPPNSGTDGCTVKRSRRTLILILLGDLELADGVQEEPAGAVFYFCELPEVIYHFCENRREKFAGDAGEFNFFDPMCR